MNYKKAIIQGGLVYAYAYYTGFSNSAIVGSNVGEVRISAPTVFALTAAITNLLSSKLQMTILPSSKSGRYSRLDSAVVSGGATAAVYIGLLLLYNPKAIEHFGLFTLGVQSVGSDIITEWISNRMM